MNDSVLIEQFGGYQTVELLGSGAFADVYRCYHPDLDSYVAIKVLHPHLARQAEIRGRFLQEAQILWQADHPRLIPVYHVDSLPSGQPYFVMRLAERGSLGSLLYDKMMQGGPFELPAVVGLGLELADCVEALRSNAVVHRDLKPDNVLVRTVTSPDLDRQTRWGLPAEERLTLTDFGLAKSLSDGSSLLSQLGGTPWYMAPELASLTARVDWRADLFAVGVMIFELAIGEVPWPHRTLEHVREVDLGQVDAGDRSGGTLPAAFDDVVRRALMPDPNERFGSPTELAAALAALVPDGATERVDVRELIDRAVDTVAPLLEDEVMTDLGAELERPRCLAVVGGERTTPEGLSLRLLGRRVEPGRGSMVGHCITRVRHAEGPSLVAVTHREERVEGRVEVADDGRLRLEIGCPLWTVNRLELELPGNQLGDAELVDVPWSIVKSDPEAASAALRATDLVIIGLPAAGAHGGVTLDAVVDLLDQPSIGPVGVIGVQAAAAWEQMPEHMPGAMAVLSSDDAAELRAVTDDVIGGDRADLLAVSSVVEILESTSDGSPNETIAKQLRTIRSTYPRLESMSAARLVVARRAGLTDEERASLVSLLARRAPQSRLGLDVHADVLSIRAEAASQLFTWDRVLGSAEPRSNRWRIAAAAVAELRQLREYRSGS